MKLADIKMMMTETPQWSNQSFEWKSNSAITILHIKFFNNGMHKIMRTESEDSPWEDNV